MKYSRKKWNKSKSPKECMSIHSRLSNYIANSARSNITQLIDIYSHVRFLSLPPWDPWNFNITLVVPLLLRETSLPRAHAVISCIPFVEIRDRFSVLPVSRHVASSLRPCHAKALAVSSVYHGYRASRHHVISVLTMPLPLSDARYIALPKPGI